MEGKQKKASCSGSPGTPSGSQQNSSVKPAASATDRIGSSSLRETSVTPTLKQTPPSKVGSLSSDSRLKLKRRRLPDISKEPTIRLARVDTEVVTNLKKPKQGQQRSPEGNCKIDDNINGDVAINSSYKRYV